MKLLPTLSLVLVLTLAVFSSSAIADTVTHTPGLTSGVDKPTLMTIQSRYEFHDGKYVWIPTHTAMAPNDHSTWMSPGYVDGRDGYLPGHWRDRNQIYTH